MANVILDDVTDLELDYYQTYDTASYPDLLTMEYLGTPVFPAPCHATVFPIPNRISYLPRIKEYIPDPNAKTTSYENASFEYYHYVGEESGWMYLDYKSWANLDFIEVYHNGLRIASTLDPQQARGYLKFLYDPASTTCYDIMVRVVSQTIDEGDPTSVYYSIWCPNVMGAREYRHDCNSYTVYSAGHPVTEDNFTLGSHADDRLILVDVDAGNQGLTTKFELYASDDRLLDTTITDGVYTLEYYKDKDDRTLDQVCVRVTSAIGCDWSIYVHCPIEIPEISVPDYEVPYDCNAIADMPDDDWIWKRIYKSDVGVTRAECQWYFGYEYAVVCRDVAGTAEISTNIFPMFENQFIPSGSHRMQLGPDSDVLFYRDRGNLAGAGIRTLGNGQNRILSVWQRRLRIGTPERQTNSWQKIDLGYPSAHPYSYQLEAGYEYRIMRDNQLFFTTNWMHLNRDWSTGSPTYMFGRERAWCFWASNDGYGSVRYSNQHVSATWEFVAPVTGTYSVTMSGDDDPIFGMYDHSYDWMVANSGGGFNWRNRYWGSIAPVWQYAQFDDGHDDTGSVHLERGQVYTVRTYCHNDNGGNARMVLTIRAPGQAFAGSYDMARGVTQSHIIVPPADNAGITRHNVAIVDQHWNSDVVLTTDNVVHGLDHNGSCNYPTLMSIYRRPIYWTTDADGDSDLQGWRVDLNLNMNGTSRHDWLWDADRDYYMYVSGAADHLYFRDGWGAAQRIQGTGLIPLRFFLTSHVADIDPQTWNATHGIISTNRTASANFRADNASVLSSTRHVRIEGSASGIVTILSRPLKVYL